MATFKRGDLEQASTKLVGLTDVQREKQFHEQPGPMLYKDDNWYFELPLDTFLSTTPNFLLNGFISNSELHGCVNCHGRKSSLPILKTIALSNEKKNNLMRHRAQMASRED